ncbi:clostripain-related cysteine peptidase [Paraburkholderia bannensis]|uniref:clostripain-related cysteine peptidase n=1 Tax=Paraburkholderia bannensis TaxID=765414 RepID=UPI002ABE087D|nr:clostripain-related cysteine peptidase [Paraburkholderia bannensis]
MKKIWSTKWWLSLLIPLVLAACNGDSGSNNSGSSSASNDNSDPVPTAAAASTVMIYMLGTDLESGNGNATKNLQALLAATPSKDVNVVVTTGGAKKTDPNGLVTDWTVVRRYVVHDGKLQMLADLGKTSMVESATLSDFIVWAKKNYPAQNYRLIMWDHGGGPIGFGPDEIFPGPVLTLPKLQQALSAARAQTGIHFDVIGFDACLMASAEVALAVAPYADYLAASEELEPGTGWDYKALFSALAENTKMDGLEFARTITDSYLAIQKSDADAGVESGTLARSDAFVTFSVIKLDQVANLLTALKTFGTELADYAQQSTDNWVRVATERTLTSSFGPQSTEELTFDMADLSVFADRLAAVNIIPEASRSVSAAVNQAVVYRGNGPQASVTSGLSIYFPSLKLDGTTLTNVYPGLDFPNEYKSLLQTYVKYADLQKSLISIDASKSSGSTLDALVKSTFGMKYAMLVRTAPTATPNVVRMLEAQPLMLAGDRIQVTTDVNGAWPLLNGQRIILTSLGSETRNVGGVDKEIKSFGVNAYVNDQYAQLVFEQDPATNMFSYVGAWDLANSDESTPTAERMNIELKPTDQITLVDYTYDLVKQEYGTTARTNTQFAAGKMAITYDNAARDASDMRLLVTDFRSAIQMSNVLPVHF